MGTLLQDGIDAAKSGRMEEALKLLRRSAEENPQNADVWVWLSAIIDDEEKQTEFLQKALEIDPENKPAQRGMAFLKRKKFIAPKPGETLSDHTRPIGVFKTGAEKPGTQQPVGSLAQVPEPQAEPLSPEAAADYDSDTENTIPPDQVDLGGVEEAVEGVGADEIQSSELGAVTEEVSETDESAELELDVEDSLTSNVLEMPEDQATQVSPVIAAADLSGKEVAEGEIEPELDLETQVAPEESPEIEEPAAAEEKPEEHPEEHPLITEAKRLKWQLLLYGLILAAFIVIGILVGSTLKNLIAPQKQNLSMNIEPIAKQNGVFLLDGQEFRRINILKEFPKEDAGLILTDLMTPQIIFKDQMVTDSSKLKLMDANQSLITSQIKMLEEKIPILEPEGTLDPGRYCISYVLGSTESQAVYWCFVIN